MLSKDLTDHDCRFDEVRSNCVKFSIWFFFQFISVWLMSLPQVILNGEPSNPGIGTLDIIGWIIWVIGFLCEAISDHQKFVFKMNPANKGHWCDVGLWKYSRHPNYFGGNK
jgi:steroid 5-alpha reductase family enzyme